MNGQINMMGSIEHYVTQHSPPPIDDTTQFGLLAFVLCFRSV